MNRWFWYWCAVVVGLHAALLNSPPVNLEFAFLEGAKSLADPGYREGAERYFTYQANPLGYSLLTALLWKVFHLPPAIWSLRVMSLVGAVAILYAGRQWFRILRPESIGLFNLWAAVTTLCPLVWLYTGRGTADVLPAGLVCLAITWCCQGRDDARYHMLAGACFALAAVVKFNSLLVGCVFVLLIVRQPGTFATRLRRLACYTLLPAAVLGAYFFWLHSRFGVLLVDNQFKSVHNPIGYSDQFWTVLALYLSYLAMLPGLLSLRPLLFFAGSALIGKKLAIAAATVALAALFGMLLHSADVGEMRFGGFDYLLPPLVFVMLRGGCLVLALALLAELLIAAVARRDELSQMLVAALVPYLVVSSLSRPAQRYLLICLPLVLFYLIAAAPPSLRRATHRLGWASALVFAGMSFLGTWYTVEQGGAVQRMVNWIQAHGQLNETAAGDIEAHAGNQFPLRPTVAPRFHVSTRPQPGSLHEERVHILGRRLRTYYLCPRESTAEAPHPTATGTRR